VGERPLHTRKVAGSKPAAPIRKLAVVPQRLCWRDERVGLGLQWRDVAAAPAHAIAVHGYESSPRRSCLVTDAGAGWTSIARRRTLAVRPRRAWPTATRVCSLLRECRRGRSGCPTPHIVDRVGDVAGAGCVCRAALGVVLAGSGETSREPAAAKVSSACGTRVRGAAHVGKAVSDVR
jgi:hypothetical protein